MKSFPARIELGHECELLLCCARTHLDTEQKMLIQSLVQQDVDWDRLLQMAEGHGVMPLLYRNLDRGCPDRVPQDVRAYLRNHFVDNAASNLARTQELLKLLALFQANDISAVPLKGPVLAASIYGNLALRQFCDLDILVRPTDASNARDLMLAHGYRLRAERDDAQPVDRFSAHREFQLTDQEGRTAIDLQWHIPSDWRTVRAFPLGTSSLWERLDTFALAGASVLTFAPQDLMLVLCVHGASHGWGELRFVCDIAELLRCHPNVDLDRTWAQASELGIARMFLLGLFLAHDLLGANLPAPVCDRVQADPMVRRLAVQVREWLFGKAGERYLGRRLAEALFSIRLRERPGDKIPHVFYFLDYPRRHVSAWLRARNAVL